MFIAVLAMGCTEQPTTTPTATPAPTEQITATPNVDLTGGEADLENINQELAELGELTGELENSDFDVDVVQEKVFE